jgi:hypothetical protein
MPHGRNLCHLYIESGVKAVVTVESGAHNHGFQAGTIVYVLNTFYQYLFV